MRNRKKFNGRRFEGTKENVHHLTINSLLKKYEIKAKILYEKKLSPWKVKFSYNQQIRAN